MQQRYESKKKGFSLLSFFLGILFGIIIVFGSVAGAIYYVLCTDLDDVFGMLEIDNEPDENGRHKLINTDEEAGGVKTVLDLFGRLFGPDGIVTKGGELTLGDFDKLIPATKGFVDSFVEGFSEYIILDADELMSVTFDGLGDYLQGIIEDIELAGVLGSFAEDGENVLLNVLIYGNEADTVKVGGTVYPIFYEEYEDVEGVYKKVKGGDEYGDTLPDNLVQYLYKKSESSTKLRLHFYEKEGEKYVVVKEGGVALARSSSNYEVTSIKYTLAEEQTVKYTGYYYYPEEGADRVYIKRVTLGTFIHSSGFGPLETVELMEFIQAEDGILSEILGGVTLGDLMSGEVTIESKIQNMKLSAFIDVKPDNKIMSYLAYGITNVRKEGDEWFANYTADDGRVFTCRVETSGEGADEIIKKVYYEEDDTQIEVATTVGGIGDVIGNVGVDIFLEVQATNKILVYLCYGLTDVKYDGDTKQGTGKFKVTEGEEVTYIDCIIKADSSDVVTSVYYSDDEGHYLPAANMDDLNSRINSLTSELKIKDIIEIDSESSKLMQKLGEYTITNIDVAIDELEITDVLSIDIDSKIMVYLAYGVSGVTYNDGNWTGKYKYTEKTEESETVYTQTVFIEVGEDNTITRVYYLEEMTEKEVPGTAINDIGSRIDGIMEDLTLGELIDIPDDSDNAIFYALRNTTINNLSDKVASLTINELYADDIYASIDENGKAKWFKAVSSVEDGESEIEFNAKYLYYVKDENGNYSLVNGDGRLAELPSEGEYFTHGEVSSLWQLLLYTGDDNSQGLDGKVESAFKINDIGKMVPNVTDNLGISTLRQLVNANILTISDEALKTKMPTEDNPDRTFGDMTLSEAIDLLVENLENLGRLGS